MEIAVKILLYYAPIACSLAPYITLTEAGAEFEVRSINLRKGQQNHPSI
jgi:glutathione S-transferase